MERKTYKTVTGNEGVSYAVGGEERARTVVTEEYVVVVILGTETTYRVDSTSNSDVILSEWIVE